MGWIVWDKGQHGLTMSDGELAWSSFDKALRIITLNRCDSNKFQDIIFTKATGMMFLRNRIKFFRPDGTRGDSPGCGSVLIAFGRENAEILRNCSLQGKYVELNNDK